MTVQAGLGVVLFEDYLFKDRGNFPKDRGNLLPVPGTAGRECQQQVASVLWG